MNYSLDEIEARFTGYEVGEYQAEHIKMIREEAKCLAGYIDSKCPDSREKSLAFTKLEEVTFWANAAIARHG